MQNNLKLARSERGTVVAETGIGQTLQEWEAEFASQMSIGSPEAAKSLLRQFINASGLSRNSPVSELNAAMHVLLELKPQDLLELQLMMQMLAAARQSLELIGESGKAKDPHIKGMFLGLSSRMMRLYTRQIEALAKYRRKTQVIRIEKVTMEGNSQAVFGLEGG